MISSCHPFRGYKYISTTGPTGSAGIGLSYKGFVAQYNGTGTFSTSSILALTGTNNHWSLVYPASVPFFSNGTFIVPTTGLYNIKVMLLFDEPSTELFSPDTAILNINVNNLPLYSTTTALNTVTDVNTLIFSMDVLLSLSDIVYLSLRTLGGIIFEINTTYMNPYWAITQVA
jgi:hypothetical protein